MERNPEWRGEEPAFDEIQFIKYGTQDAVERALKLGEIDMDPRGPAGDLRAARRGAEHRDRASPTPAYTELAFNLCPEEDCPDAKFNPAVQDSTVRQAIAYAIDRERINEIAPQGTSFVANGILPSFYKSFYEEPEQTTPYDPELANQILDDAGWALGDDGGPRPRAARSSRSTSTCARSRSSTVQTARLIAEMTAGDRGRVQRPGGQHRQARPS